MRKPDAGMRRADIPKRVDGLGGVVRHAAGETTLLLGNLNLLLVNRALYRRARRAFIYVLALVGIAAQQVFTFLLQHFREKRIVMPVDELDLRVLRTVGSDSEELVNLVVFKLRVEIKPQLTAIFLVADHDVTTQCRKHNVQ